ncbi:MAG TPA: transposase [Saprospiraceae bacterium]|nr:transposase [Saprospiraceae bacterium]
MKSLLPHLYNGHKCFFITFRLADSLPLSVITELKNKFQEDLNSIREDNQIKRRIIIDELRVKYFIKYEHQLDSKPYGDCVLRKNDIAQILYDKILSYHNKYYKLHCFCIMPNHVHILLSTLDDSELVPLGKWLQLIKGGSAYLINKALNRTGRLWGIESFDRYIRNEEHFYNSYNYTINNPILAKLSKNYLQKPFLWIADQYEQ